MMSCSPHLDPNMRLPLLYVDGYVQPAVQLNMFTILPTAELELSKQIN